MLLFLTVCQVLLYYRFKAIVAIKNAKYLENSPCKHHNV